MITSQGEYSPGTNCRVIQLCHALPTKKPYIIETVEMWHRILRPSSQRDTNETGLLGAGSNRAISNKWPSNRFATLLMFSVHV